MTESSHNLTGVKTIFSVRAQRQHLFVLDKMIAARLLYCFQQEASLRLLLPCVVVCVSSQTVYIKFVTKSSLTASVHSYLC